MELFNRMELYKSIYEGYGSYYQNKYRRADANRSSDQKTQAGESTLATGSVKCRSGRRMNKNVNISKSNNPDKPSCLIHGDRHSYEEFSVLHHYG